MELFGQNKLEFGVVKITIGSANVLFAIIIMPIQEICIHQHRVFNLEMPLIKHKKRARFISD